MNKLIAIPALGCDSRLYAGTSPRLEGRVEVASQIVDSTTFAGCAGQILRQQPDNFIIMGTSFGGRVALETTLLAPGRVKGLIVIGAGAGPVADRAAGLRRSERMRGGEFEKVIEEMAAIISHLPAPNGPSTRDLFITMAGTQGQDLVARQSDALAGRTDLWPRLGEIACPALFLWGRHDQFSPAQDGLRMSTLVQKGRYVEIAECGHFPTLEAPEESAEAIGHWLADFDLG